MLSGIATDPVWRRCYEKLVQSHKAQGGDGSEPEFRLISTMYGAFLVPVALFGKHFVWRASSNVLNNYVALITTNAGFGWTTFPFVSNRSDKLLMACFRVLTQPGPCRCIG